MPQLKTYPLYLSLLFIIVSCSETKNQEEETTVEGSWDLIEIKDHNLNKWNAIDDTLMYQKHITPNSFVWLNYDKKNERLIGTGGGTFDFSDDQYTEYIAFFFPPIESLIGQPIPFDVEFKNGQWFHTGYFINETTDPISGEITKRDTVKIEEIWERTDRAVNENEGLIGTWRLLKYREDFGEDYIEFPDFYGSIKLITSTHFTWIQYDRNGDEVYAIGSGTYTFDEDLYNETIDIIYPENTGQIGESIQFKYELNDNLWFHYGFVPEIRIDSGNIVRDSILIDEFWVPFQISNVNELLL